jgi:hypothetical protein
MGQDARSRDFQQDWAQMPRFTGECCFPVLYFVARILFFGRGFGRLSAQFEPVGEGRPLNRGRKIEHGAQAPRLATPKFKI